MHASPVPIVFNCLDQTQTETRQERNGRGPLIFGIRIINNRIVV